MDELRLFERRAPIRVEDVHRLGRIGRLGLDIENVAELAQYGVLKVPGDA